MKKSYIKIWIFEVIILFILTLNIFMGKVLNRYLIILFLMLLVLIFRKIFGVEKIKKRYTKDLILEISLVYLVFFLMYYLLGLVTGFYKTNNYFNIYGLFNFIFPITLVIFLKEYLRSLVCGKYENSKILYFTTFLMFVVIDLVNLVRLDSLKSLEGIFFFIATALLPAISSNIVADYIVRYSNYRINFYWLLIFNLYGYVLPIIPNTGDYILSVIRFLFPLVIYGRIKKFFNKEEDAWLERNYTKKQILPLTVATLIIVFLVYFTSGYFRYYALAIASGSMSPQIKKGDVVVINQKYDDKYLKKGQIIAYKYKDVIIVHRIVKIINKEGKNYYYTKGDKNSEIDNYVVYKENILGIVNKKIPYVGFPTIWLSQA